MTLADASALLFVTPRFVSRVLETGELRSLAREDVLEYRAKLRKQQRQALEDHAAYLNSTGGY